MTVRQSTEEGAAYRSRRIHSAVFLRARSASSPSSSRWRSGTVVETSRRAQYSISAAKPAAMSSAPWRAEASAVRRSAAAARKASRAKRAASVGRREGSRRRAASAMAPAPSASSSAIERPPGAAAQTIVASQPCSAASASSGVRRGLAVDQRADQHGRRVRQVVEDAGAVGGGEDRGAPVEGWRRRTRRASCRSRIRAAPGRLARRRGGGGREAASGALSPRPRRRRG